MLKNRPANPQPDYHAQAHAFANELADGLSLKAEMQK
jgi:hypothetical protein